MENTVVKNLIHDQINRLQKNLPYIRLVAGWSQEDLAKRLEVSRSTIVSMENKEMTAMQYYAILFLLRQEIENNCDKILSDFVNYCLAFDTTVDMFNFIDDKLKHMSKRTPFSERSFIIRQYAAYLTNNI